MSEQEGTIVEAVEESVSVATAPESASDPNIQEVDADAESSTDSSALENDANSSAVNTEKTNDGSSTVDSGSAAEAPAAESTTEAPEASTEEKAPAKSSAKKAGRNNKSDKRKIVRTLAVGQEMTGKVKRLTDFGAFVDLGVGRDGLLHVSELSVQRVNKVTDVLSQGQEVNVWIKELNREKNRISLTLISPDTKTIRDINKDEIIEGTVTRMTNFGAFIDIGIGRDALLHVREMAEGFVKRPEDVVSIGETLEVRIVEVNRRRGRVDVSIKGLRPEPESEDAPAEEGFADGEEEFVDEFEDVEPMSAIELALKRAMEADGGTDSRSKRAKRREKRDRSANEIDDIISRTLSGSEA